MLHNLWKPPDVYEVEVQFQFWIRMKSFFFSKSSNSAYQLLFGISSDQWYLPTKVYRPQKKNSGSSTLETS